MAHSNQPRSSTPPPSSGHPRVRAIVRGRKLIGNLLPISRPKMRAPRKIGGGGATTPALSCSSLGIGIVLLALEKIGSATSREHDATHKSLVRTSQNSVKAMFII